MSEKRVTSKWLADLIQPIVNKSTKKAVQNHYGEIRVSVDNLNLSIRPDPDLELPWWRVSFYGAGLPKEEYCFTTQEEFQNWFAHLFRTWKLKVRPVSTVDWRLHRADPNVSGIIHTRGFAWGLVYSYHPSKSIFTVPHRLRDTTMGLMYDHYSDDWIAAFGFRQWPEKIDNNFRLIQRFGDLKDAQRYVEEWACLEHFWAVSVTGKQLYCYIKGREHCLPFPTPTNDALLDVQMYEDWHRKQDDLDNPI